MPESDCPEGKSNESSDNHKHKFFSVGLWLVVLLGVLILGVVAGFSLYLYLQGTKDWISFLMGSLLNALIFMAIVFQAFIYSKQWKTMESGLERTDRMIDKMQLQLEAIDKQEAHLLTQAKAATTAAEMATGQLVAMQSSEHAQHDSVEETRKLVAQNERAVEADEANVETVEKTAIYANRAYMAATVDKVEERFQFHLRIDNSGNTPANNVRVAYACELLDKAPVEKTEAGQVVYDGGYKHFKALGLVAPKSNRVFVTPKGVELGLATPEHLGWKAGKFRFYVWGTIIYEDMFKQNRVKWFCFKSSYLEANGYPYEYGNYAI